VDERSPALVSMSVTAAQLVVVEAGLSVAD